MKALNAFQNVQRMEKEMEKTKSFSDSQPQSVGRVRLTLSFERDDDVDIGLLVAMFRQTGPVWTPGIREFGQSIFWPSSFFA